MIKKSVWKEYAKRMAAYLSALILMLSCIAANASDVYTDEDLAEFNENVRLLSDFGLVEEGRAAATTVKRGDFAAIMMEYLGYKVMPSDGVVYSDVPDTKSPVYAMSQMGLLDGYPDGTFRPDDNILSEQAVKVIVSALGYKNNAERAGGYPNGYIKTADQLDLLDKTSMASTSPLTYYNMVQMLVNALTVRLVEIDSRGNYSISNDTWLSSRLDSEKRKGIVTAAQGVSLNESGQSGSDTITIDGVIYSIKGDYSRLIGCYTEFYVNSENQILYIKETRNNRIEFAAEKVTKYSSKTYTAENENGKDKKYKLSQDSYIIFNGVAADNITEADMCPKYGKVTLLDNDNDNEYEAVIIDSFDIYPVQSVNASENKVYCKNADGLILDFSDISDSNLTITDSDGKSMTVADISVGSVIRAAFSKDGKKVNIIVSKKTISGTVTGIGDDGIYKIVYIDNVPYKLADERINPALMNVGRKGRFGIDSENIIASFPESDNSYSYGYLVKAYIDENTDALNIQIINDKGKKQTMACASKIGIDGHNNQNADNTLKLLDKGDSSVRQMIRFKCNSKNVVCEIDTPYNSAQDLSAKPQNGEREDTMRLIYSGTTEYTKQLHNFLGQINVDSDTLIFVVTGDDEDDYIVKSISEIPADTKFRIQAYSDDENEFYAKILFSDDKTLKNGGSDGEVIGVVAKIEESVNKDGDTAKRILFKSKNFEKELFLEEPLLNPFPYNAAQEPQYEPEVGDVITLQYSGDEASDASLVFKPREKLFPAGSSYGPLTEIRIHYIYGSVYSIEKGFMNITQKDIASEGAPSMSEVESFCLTDFVKILKYTNGRNGRKEIVPVTAEEIVDYKTAGENCSKVFISVEWEYPNLMVIYE